jgi:hypothetical protein
MQEEVGTGGAGFRYLYAAFLEEAADRLGHAPWREASERMTDAGDAWRKGFAGVAGRILKGRNATGETLGAAADALDECAAREEELYRFLLAHAPSRASVSLAAAQR